MSLATTRCSAARADGSPCRVRTGLDESGRCIWHSQDPERQRIAEASRKRGGMATARRHRRTVNAAETPGLLETMQDAVRWASWLAHATATGTIDPKTSREVATALREFRGCFHSAALEKQLEALRAEVATLRAALKSKRAGA